jgi:hypothetical protein
MWQNLPLSAVLAVEHKGLLRHLRRIYRDRLDAIPPRQEYLPEGPFSYGQDFDDSGPDVSPVFDPLLPLGADAVGIYLAETGRLPSQYALSPDRIQDLADGGGDGRLRLFRPTNVAIVARRRMVADELARRVLDPASLTLNFAREKELSGFREINKFFLDLLGRASEQGGSAMSLLGRQLRGHRFKASSVSGYWWNMMIHARRPLAVASAGRSWSRRHCKCPALLSSFRGFLFILACHSIFPGDVPKVTPAMIRERLDSFHHDHEPLFSCPSMMPDVPPEVVVTWEWLQSGECARWFLRYRFHRDFSVLVEHEHLDAASDRIFLRGKFISSPFRSLEGSLLTSWAAFFSFSCSRGQPVWTADPCPARACGRRVAWP